MKKGWSSKLWSPGRVPVGVGLAAALSFLISGCGGEGGEAEMADGQVAAIQEQMEAMQARMEAMQEMQQAQRLQMPPSLPGQTDVASRQRDLASNVDALGAAVAAPGIPGAGAGVSGAGVSGAEAGVPGMPGLGVRAGVDLSKLPGPLSEGQWRVDRAKEELAAWDTDKDGGLSEEEYLKKYVERHRRRFEGLDVDGDGLLSAEEIAEVAGPRREMAMPTMTMPGVAPAVSRESRAPRPGELMEPERAGEGGPEDKEAGEGDSGAKAAANDGREVE